MCLAACAGGPALERAARESGFARERLAAGEFELLAYRRFAPGADTLTVYIESDGAPWTRRDRPPADPTPADPLALRLALGDPGGAVAWLSRPCQYLDAAALDHCDSRYWRRARYSEQVIAAMDEAVERLQRESGARRLVLVGYSGGGAVAALLAARRPETRLLVTVGGVLDTQAWTSRHAVTALDASLNPADYAARLSSVRQVHYVGTEDRVTPPAIAEAYAAKTGTRARVVRVDGRDHDCCWVPDWPRLIAALREDPS